MKRERAQEREQEDGEYIDDIAAKDDGDVQDDEEALIERSRQRRVQILAKYGRHPHKVDEATDAAAETMADVDVSERSTHSERQGELVISLTTSSPPAGAPAPKSSDTDSEEDMFADTPEDGSYGRARNGKRVDGNRERRRALASKGLADSYDDAEGYYNFQVGEVLCDRYEVFAIHGKGVFSSVLRARDLLGLLRPNVGEDTAVGGTAMDSGNPRTPAELSEEEKNTCPQVAVKIIRANETMFKAGQLEKVILSKLSHSDPDGTMHIVKMLDSFEYRNHMCLVFEGMDMNLRDLTKKYGRGVGLHMSAVRAYATQMFVALHHLKTCGVLHADIKPDNILVNGSRTEIKLCDLGSAMFSGDNSITPYLVSRFYRAPEVILGLPYDHPIDMWSVGCVIYELFTGDILFQGRTNNHMLKVMMDVKGPFSKKMLKKAEFAFKHFDVTGNWAFFFEEEDVITKQPIKRTVDNPRAVDSLSLSKRLGLAGASPAEKRRLSQLVDLLERALVLDPEKRMSPAEALQHPFIRGDDGDGEHVGQKKLNAVSAPRAVLRASK
jgi:serine/threonine-protein kinase PRP4